MRLDFLQCSLQYLCIRAFSFEILRGGMGKTIDAPPPTYFCLLVAPIYFQCLLPKYFSFMQTPPHILLFPEPPTPTYFHLSASDPLSGDQMEQTFEDKTMENVTRSGFVNMNQFDRPQTQQILNQQTNHKNLLKVILKTLYKQK